VSRTETDPKPPALRTRTAGGRTEVWDAIRGRWLPMTPEEEVRQRVIAYLRDVKGVPPLLIRQEQPLTLNDTARRADIVVYDPAGRPRLVVECKAPSVPITRRTLEQVVRYNIVLNAPCLWITNGKTNRCYRYHAAENRFEPLDEIPDFDRLVSLAENDGE
jgi:hypothetical protein